MSLTNVSRQRMTELDSRLVLLLSDLDAIGFPYQVAVAHRGEEAQNKAHAEGKSDKEWPDSNHNTIPATAVDLVPDPLDYKDRERFVWMAGLMMGFAFKRGIKLRWGGDFNRNWKIRDEKLQDLTHFELILD